MLLYNRIFFGPRQKWVIGMWAQHSLELCVWEGRD